MYRQRNARHAVLLLAVLAVAFLWAGDQGIRAAANDRAEMSATPATAPPPATPAKSAAAKPAAPAKAAPQGKGAIPQMTPQEMKQRKIKPEQRQAAAANLKKKKAAGLLTATALVTGLGGELVPDYFGGVPNWAFSPQPTVNTATTPWTVTPGTGLRKFVDPLPNLPVAVPDTTSFPGSDYYEIELFESSWTFHTDLTGGVFSPTKQRMYRQTPSGNASPPAPGYLGPVIVAQKGRPTRIKFTNSLPITGAGGELFIPTDTTVMGAGAGYDPGTNTMGTYPQNRGTLHLHGGFTPWISDGTPHQWVTPTGEGGVLKTGVSTEPVPDMAIPSGNSMTFYWTNQQSGRLMFYHDHAYGITRLNVYAGEAAGYLLVDPVERGLNATIGVISDSSNPTGYWEIPLVIQDKTFVWGTAPVPCGATVPGTGTFATDPTWCDPIRTWGQVPGSLWFPHVYMPNQNPADVSGANSMGRWDYALWFWPPFAGLIAHGQVPNPYDPTQMIPGTPNPSLVPEAFMDTPIVNGKAYPTKNVPAGLVRLRILNAANDRFQNLSLWVAADKTTQTTSTVISGLPAASTALCRGLVAVGNCTEVKMVPFNSSSPGGPFPANWYTTGNFVVFDDRSGGVPDPATRGPAMIQIGTEGGLLPAPAVILNQPVNFTYNPKNIVVGSVEQHALLLGPAERADVIVDFSAFAGHTLILYNDAPSPIPAADLRLDYFTGGGGLDRAATGGTTMTMPGYGPNTRTIMRFVVAGSLGAGTPDYVDTTLCSPALPVNGVPGPVGCTAGSLNQTLADAFRKSQDPIIVPQAAYNLAYGTAVPNATGANVSRISDTSLTFVPLASTCLPGTTNATNSCVPVGPAKLFNMQPKAIQELFELDYGRMNATLGVELPFTNGGNQTTLPMGYIEPATEIINSSGLVALPPSGTDGTQLWKITHNGVDTHAIHVHLFNVQVINRVGWDGAIRLPDLNELGWKETVRMNPLEDIVVALRPTTPALPFGVPNSVRLLAPALAPGTPIDTFDTTTGNPIVVNNALYNFGWEYVWHCHLLGHEENDMMRPTVFSVTSDLPMPPVVTLGQTTGVIVNWTDGTPYDLSTGAPVSPNYLGNPANEIGFRIERAIVASNGKIGTYSVLGYALANKGTFSDPAVLAGTKYSYRLVAFNAAGESASAAVSITVGGVSLPLAPTGLTATLVAGPRIQLTWTDNATNETGFNVFKCTGAGCLPVSYPPGLPAKTNTGTVTWTDSVAPVANTTYVYRVYAVNSAGSVPNTPGPVSITPLVPGTPTLNTPTVVRSGNNDKVTLTWLDIANETSYTVQRCAGTNAVCAAAAATSWTSLTTTLAANTTTYTDTVARSPVGTPYSYRIRGVNLVGPGPFSNIRTIVTQ